MPVWYCQVLTMIFNIELKPVQSFLGQCASLVLSGTYHDIQYWTQASTVLPRSMCQFGIVRYLPWYSILNSSQYRPSLVNVPVWYCQVLTMIFNIELKPVQAVLGQCASLVLSRYLPWYSILNSSQYRPSLVNMPVWYCHGTYHDIQYWTQASTVLPWPECQFGIVTVLTMIFNIELEPVQSFIGQCASLVLSRYLPWYSILNSSQYSPSLVNVPVWYCHGTYHDIQYWTQASTVLPWSMCQFGIVTVLTMIFNIELKPVQSFLGQCASLVLSRYLPWYSILNSSQYSPSLVNVPVWYCHGTYHDIQYWTQASTVLPWSMCQFGIVMVLTMIFNIELKSVEALLGQYASLVLSGTYHDIQYWTQASTGPPWSICQFGIVRYLPWYSILNSSQYSPSLARVPEFAIVRCSSTSRQRRAKFS